MDNAVTKDQVRARALRLWEQHGRPLGRDLEFWLQAEHELKEERAAEELDEHHAKGAEDQHD